MPRTDVKKWYFAPLLQQSVPHCANDYIFWVCEWRGQRINYCFQMQMLDITSEEFSKTGPKTRFELWRKNKKKRARERRRSNFLELIKKAHYQLWAQRTINLPRITYPFYQDGQIGQPECPNEHRPVFLPLSSLGSSLDIVIIGNFRLFSSLSFFLCLVSSTAAASEKKAASRFPVSKFEFPRASNAGRCT